MKSIKRTGIIGAGCLGIMYYRQLSARYGAENVFFIADRARIDRYGDFYCNGEKCHLNFVDKDVVGEPADLIIFANKFTTIDEAVEYAGGFTGEDTILISVLNGIASEDVIGERLGKEHLLYCMVQGMDTTRRGSSITYQSIGTVVFGDRLNRRTEDVMALESYLSGAGLDYLVPDDIIRKLWSKLMLNVGVNQVAAVFDCGYGGLQRQGRERDMMLSAMAEVKAVAAFEGITLTEGDVTRWMTVLDTLSPQGMPSMQQDIRAGRKTELELFAGTIKKLGKKHGVETPVNDFLYSEITRLEERF